MLTLLIDWNRTLYNPEKKSLYQDTIPFLQKVCEICTVYIISAGEIPDAYEQKEKILPYTKNFIVETKTNKLFSKIVKNTPKNSIIVIGDSITQEIKIANELGFTSIRILRGKYKNEIPTNKKEIPTYTAHSLKKILLFLSLSF